MPIVNGTLHDDGGAVVNVMNPQFGAVGDGVADDAEAIQAARTHAAALGGGWVTLPRIHRLDDDLVFDNPAVGLQVPAGGRVRPAEGRLVRVSGPLQADGPWIDLSLGGEVDFTRGWPGVAHAAWWGATGDGVADDTPALAAAAFVLGRNGGTLSLAPGTYHLASDLAFLAAVTLILLPGAVLKPAVGKVVTVNGPVQAGSWRWIDTSAGGRVRFGPGVLGEVSPQWWGARADGTTDATAAFAAAMEALSDAGGGTLLLSDGSYLLTDFVTLPFTAALRVLPGASVKLGDAAILVLEGVVQAPDLPWIDRAPGAMISFSQVNAVVAPQWWGAVADGATDCAAALGEAANGMSSALGGTLRLPAGRYRVEADVQLGPAGGLRVEPGAILEPVEGVTVVVCMAMSAMATQWIDLSNGGKVIITQDTGMEIIPHWWGARGCGEGDDGPALAAALQSIASAGGGRLFLPAGDYPVETAVSIVGDSVRVEGGGDGSILRAGSSPELAGQHLLRAADGSSGVSVAHLRMVGRGAAEEGPGGFSAGAATRGVWVERCTFEAFGWAGGTDHGGSTRGGVRDCAFRQSARGAVLSGTLGPQDVSISGCDFEDVGTAVDVQYGSGSLVTGNAISYTATYPGDSCETVPIRVRGQSGTRVIGNEIDSRAWTAASFLRMDAGIRLGEQEELPSQPGYGFPNHVLVMGNVIRGGAFSAIELLGAHDCDIVNNQIETLPGEVGIDIGINLGPNMVVDPSVPTTRTSVSGNRVAVSECGCGAAIYELYGGYPQWNSITDNPWLTGAPDMPTIDVDPESDVTVRNNGGFPTEAAGTAAIGAADTFVAVTTGVARGLAPEQILLTPLSSLGAAARFWVQNVDSTARTFEIALDAAPGGTGAGFAWRVMD